MTSFEPGDRVQTPAGNTGTVQPPPFNNPLYSLIAIDGGQTIWIKNELLSPSSVPAPPIRSAKAPAGKGRSRRSSKKAIDTP